MALQSTTFLDIPDAIQSLTYTLSGTTIDVLTYESNTVTFNTISTFNLSKSDLIIYISMLNTFYNLLVVNFPTIQNSRAVSLPLSSFEILLSASPIEHIYFIQTSLGNSIYTINYVPIAQSCSFASRTSTTISMQEFMVMIDFMNQYLNQISLN